MHTPAPWTVDTRHHVHAVICTPTRDGEKPEVCFFETRGHPTHGGITARCRTDAELLANARLTVAAPDLLAALEAIMSNQIGGNVDCDAKRVVAARDAVAKARGMD